MKTFYCCECSFDVHAYEHIILNQRGTKSEMSRVFTTPEFPLNSIYVGSKQDAVSSTFLRANGIKAVLNCTPPREKDTAAGIQNFFEKGADGLTLSYKRVPVYDIPTTNLLNYAEEVTSFLRMSLYHGSVLVHCKHGVSRSVTCALFYLIKEAGLSLDEGLIMIRASRPDAKPIAAFLEQLQEWETTNRAAFQERKRKEEKKRAKAEKRDKKRKRKEEEEEEEEGVPKEKVQKGPVLGPTAGPTAPAPAAAPAPAPATEDETWLKYDKSKQGTSSRIGFDFQASLPACNPSSYSSPVVAEAPAVVDTENIQN